MIEKNKSEVPEELLKKQESKELSYQKAQDQIENEVNKGESVLSAIGYISFLCILPLVLLKGSKYGQYHGKQALVLAIFIYFFDFLNILPARFVSVYVTGKIILILYCILMAAKGRYFKIPFIYKISEQFSIDIKEENKKPIS